MIDVCYIRGKELETTEDEYTTRSDNYKRAHLICANKEYEHKNPTESNR